MKTDATGAPWPYADEEPAPESVPEPSWECPEGICECHPQGTHPVPVSHRIHFFDEQARRMPATRCRVIERGRLVNLGQPYGDAAGSVQVDIRSTSKMLQLEWAPQHVPEQEPYPFRQTYYVEFPPNLEESVARRLHNIGFDANPTLEENVRDFQHAYRLPRTGRPEDIESILRAFHDEAMLPPRGAPVAPAVGDPQPGHQLDEPTVGQPARPGIARPVPPGGTTPQRPPVGSAAASPSVATVPDRQPPRLSVAINKASCEEPPTAEAACTAQHDSRGRLIASKANLSATGVPDPRTITAIIRWIENRALSCSWDAIWECESLVGSSKTWSPTLDPQSEQEEQWARAFEELFLGAGFRSPAGAYDLTFETGGRLSPEGWLPYVFGRIQRGRRRVFQRERTSGGGYWGSCEIENWQNPEPIPESKFRHYWSLWLDEDPYEPSYKVVPGKVGPTQGQQLVADPKGPRWLFVENLDPAVPLAVACQHLATYGALTRGFRIEHVGYHGYNVGHHQHTLPLFGECEYRGYIKYEKEHLDQERAGEDWGEWARGPANPNDPAEGTVYVHIKHSRCVVRMNHDASRLQLLETNSRSTDVKDQFIFNMALATMASAGYGAVPGNMGPLLGRGRLPAWTPVELGEMADHLRRARPVGLMRLLITRRNTNEVLFVTPMVRAYGDAADQNYTVARMLWAARRSPGFTNLRPYVAFFAPQGAFGRAMWAHDARQVAVHKLAAAHGKPTARGLVLATNERSARPDQAGAASWRTWKDDRSWYRVKHAIASETVRKVAERTPYDEFYVHPSLEPWRRQLEEAPVLFREVRDPQEDRDQG